MEVTEWAELVEAAQNDDQRAFEELVKRTYADTYTLAFRMTSNEEDARDVVQETYIRAHKGLKRFRGDAQFTTWLYRITANCANTYLGRRVRTHLDPLPDDYVIADDRVQHDPQLRADLSDQQAELTRALAALPPKLRSVIVLRDIYDLSHESIAEELEISPTAAKVRLHRARKRLKDSLYTAEKREDPRAV